MQNKNKTGNGETEKSKKNVENLFCRIINFFPEQR